MAESSYNVNVSAIKNKKKILAETVIPRYTASTKKGNSHHAYAYIEL